MLSINRLQSGGYLDPQEKIKPLLRALSFSETGNFAERVGSTYYPDGCLTFKAGFMLALRQLLKQFQFDADDVCRMIKNDVVFWTENQQTTGPVSLTILNNEYILCINLSTRIIDLDRGEFVDALPADYVPLVSTAINLSVLRSSLKDLDFS